jgi:hypothetical protein
MKKWDAGSAHSKISWSMKNTRCSEHQAKKALIIFVYAGDTGWRNWTRSNLQITVNASSTLVTQLSFLLSESDLDQL